MKVKNSRALVTGASRGLGRSVAEELARRGADVALVARNREQLEQSAEELGGKAYPTDLTDPDAVAALVDRVQADGPVDILVNNAGLDCVGFLPDTSAQQMRDVMQVNLLTPMELCRQLMPQMVARGRGHLVNVSSMGAVSVSPGVTVYATSKAGLSHFTAGIRGELRNKPVGTTLVQIGNVKTDMLDGIREFGPARRTIERFEKLHMLPDDLDPAVVATAMVDAIEKERRHVRLPRSVAPTTMMVEFPRRMSEVLSIGLDLETK